MAKSLTDLTARTATANSDLIHVNSGGTDYKETKENFLNELYATQSAPADADTLISATGSCWCQGSTTANLPASSSGFYCQLVYFPRVQIAIQHAGTNNIVNAYFRNYANNQWYPWRRVTLGTTGTVTVTNGSNVTGSTNFSVQGNLCVLNFTLSLAAGTYTGGTSGTEIVTVAPVPQTLTRGVLLLGGDAAPVMITTAGKMFFNSTKTITSAQYLLGQLIYSANALE